ncbi:uncharacterized protein LOC117176315 isoform X2 [Belonocnema kinseyi]|uniref:uncharacterized protein LOC117176315 isoform X2 n=1 Tax=Belonocnema kinseyi TaxID=2817044 RepID=UPI00143DEC8D|nr:uncharacterized protein LOC117176315 isoform X2 [Belonocnema kinseyi]
MVTEIRKKGAHFSLKMTLSPNIEVISTKDPKDVKYDKSLLNQVLNLILMMIGCILLKIDYKPRVKKRFKDIFSDRSLEMLRSDLENLLCFESKSSVTWMLMDLMNSQAASELNWSEDLKNCTDTKKFMLKRTLISVVNFMIFRRSKQKITAKNKTRRSVSTLESGNNLENGESIISLNGSKSKAKITFLCAWLRNFHNVKRFIGICRHLFSAIDFMRNDKDFNFDMDLSQGQLNLYGDDFYDCTSNSGIHSCKKIYCPICFGWLWIPFYYLISIFIFPLVKILVIKFTNGIRFLP